jgi:hypothetical protein
MRLSLAKIQNATAQKKTVRLFDGRGLYLKRPRPCPLMKHNLLTDRPVEVARLVDMRCKMVDLNV